MAGESAVLHIKSSLPGRLRLHLAGLKHNSRLAACLEQELLGHSYIRAVKANLATGSLLSFMNSIYLLN